MTKKYASDHHLKVGELLLGIEQRLDLIADGVGFLDELLRLLAIIPEILARHDGVELALAVL